MRKITCLVLLVATLICTLASCVSSTGEPIEVAKKLNDNDYYVEMMVDDGEIEELTDEIEAKSKGIVCILAAEPEDYDEMGIVFFCDKRSTAKELKDDIIDYFDKNEYEADRIVRFTVESSGSVVFVGCEDAWEIIK